MFKRKHFVAIAITALISLLILALPTRLSLVIRASVSNLFLPLFGLASGTEAISDTAALKLMPRSRLESEVGRLIHENAELRFQVEAAQETAKENARLRTQLGWEVAVPRNLKSGQVILRDPANWWRAVQINLGSRDGVTVDAPVMTTDGLIGRVSSVATTHSQVVLLGDPRCRVSALIDDLQRNTGIIESVESLGGALVEMTYLPRHAKIEPGTIIRTSGLGGLFPKGIKIGQVVDTRLVEYGLHQTARVRLSANLSALEEVWVIVD